MSPSYVRMCFALLVLVKCLGKKFQTFDYCKYNCLKMWHPACPKPCFSDYCAFLPATSEFRSQIVLVHNTLRDKVASGKFNNFSSAADMMTLSYDMELEFFAYCWAVKNKDGFNRCAKTKDGEDTGQNMLIVNTNTVKKDELKAAFDTWLPHYKQLTVETIKKYQPPAGNETYPYFTQLIHSKTQRIGCGRCKTRVGNRTYLTCYYCPAGNVKGSPVYTDGTPATQCPSGTEPNKFFTSLCGESHLPHEGTHVFIESASKTTAWYCITILLVHGILTMA